MASDRFENRQCFWLVALSFPRGWESRPRDVAQPRLMPNQMQRCFPGSRKQRKRIEKPSFRLPIMKNWRAPAKSPIVSSRSVSDRPLIVPLISSFVRVCECTPHLENAHLVTQVDGWINLETNGYWVARVPGVMHYVPPGYKSRCQAEAHGPDIPPEGLHTSRLTIKSRKWRLAEYLLE